MVWAVYYSKKKGLTVVSHIDRVPSRNQGQQRPMIILWGKKCLMIDGGMFMFLATKKQDAAGPDTQQYSRRLSLRKINLRKIGSNFRKK